MFVSGFTFIKNAIELDYPVKAALDSILPLCDELVVAVGDCEDGTRDLVASIDSKIRIIDTVWNADLRQGGKVLADETNKALDAVSNQADWCIYIQADECLHQEDHAEIKAAMKAHKDNAKIEGLLFNYKHFYGSYDYVGDSRRWYRKEIRIVKPKAGLRSYKDAQGFRINDEKLRVVPLNAHVYHYGWVRHPKYQMRKQVVANKLWHDDAWVEERFNSSAEFDYSEIDFISRFNGSHPRYIQKRIQAMNWQFDRDLSKRKISLKHRLLYFIEKYCGWRIGEYKNYKI